ncbi:hypothetical protein [Paracoccus sp. J56]|uniref:hypothetical protein n=1 Tax=Paracoccus sp. J56 TaxID=935850 RepID=UPI00111C6653|nr:hypothetical protein [Paracoccus sp. J56]
MRVELTEEPLPCAKSTYDRYYSFYYTANHVWHSEKIHTLFNLRDDFKIIIQDSLGEVIDIICTDFGKITSVAFRNKIDISYEFSRKPVVENVDRSRLALVDGYCEGNYNVDIIKTTAFPRQDGKIDILLSFSKQQDETWFPISKSAFVSVDENMEAVSFLFVGVEYIDD